MPSLLGVSVHSTMGAEGNRQVGVVPLLVITPWTRRSMEETLASLGLWRLRLVSVMGRSRVFKNPTVSVFISPNSHWTFLISFGTTITTFPLYFISPLFYTFLVRMYFVCVTYGAIPQRLPSCPFRFPGLSAGFSGGCCRRTFHLILSFADPRPPSTRRWGTPVGRA